MYEGRESRTNNEGLRLILVRTQPRAGKTENQPRTDSLTGPIFTLNLQLITRSVEKMRLFGARKEVYPSGDAMQA